MSTKVLSFLPKELLQGKTKTVFNPETIPLFGIYFSAHWCAPCRNFTPKLINFYNTVNKSKKRLEIIFCSSDQSEEDFDEYYSTMPWMAIPFDDEIKEKFDDEFSVEGIPTLLLFNNKGDLVDSNARMTVQNKAENEKFDEKTAENIIDDWINVKTLEEKLLSILPKEFNKGENSEKFDINSVPIFGLYFSAHWCPPCQRFTPKLIKFYNSANKNKKEIEIIFCSFDKEESQFKEYYGKMPWLAIKYNEKDKNKELANIFKIDGIPTFIVFDNKGKIVDSEAFDIVERKANKETGEYNEEDIKKIIDDWKNPKSPEEKLISILPKEVLNGSKKETLNINNTKIFGIYFSAHWCPPCRMFTPVLAQFYKTLNKNKKQLEIFFCSSDKNQEDFNEYYGTMPWLSFPLVNEAKMVLSKMFKIRGIPTLLIFNEKGKLIDKDARGNVQSRGKEDKYDEKVAQSIFDEWIKKASV